MKKITLIAAAAALVLCGGVFVKVNNSSKMLIRNIVDAVAQTENTIWDYPDQLQDKKTCTMYIFHSNKYAWEVAVDENDIESLKYWGYRTQDWYSAGTKNGKRIDCTGVGFGCTPFSCSLTLQ